MAVGIRKWLNSLGKTLAISLWSSFSTSNGLIFFTQYWLGKALLSVAISLSLVQLCTMLEKIRSYFTPHLHSQEHQPHKEQWHQSLEKCVGLLNFVTLLKLIVQSPLMIVYLLQQYQVLGCRQMQVVYKWVNLRRSWRCRLHEEVVQTFMDPCPAALPSLLYHVPMTSCVIHYD